MSVAGILLHRSGPTLYCDSAAFNPVVGDRLLVETEHGRLLGRVVSLHDETPQNCVQEKLSVVRPATEDDLIQAETNENLASRARRFCRNSIRERSLDMKLVDVEVYFDAGKIVFYFTAPARIDFRDLLKDLVREYRARIELRQIGVRHETQMIGALGNCGMVCCCRRFLRKFAPVTIRMAKEQNLFLNPAKISGICGRLLCCLSYEQENYDAFHRECPRLGKRYRTDQGNMRILRANMFHNSIHVITENGEEKELALEEWRGLNPRRPEQAPQQPQRQPERREPPKHDPDAILVVSLTPGALNDPLFDVPADELPAELEGYSDGDAGSASLSPDEEKRAEERQKNAEPAEKGSKSKRRSGRK